MVAEIQFAGSLPVVVPPSRLDTVSAPQFDADVASLLSQPHKRILLDMSGVTYISSAGLRSVLQLVKHTGRSGGRLALAGVTPQIQEILEISGFNPLMDIYPDRESALTASQP